jgi:16S rRNA G1207 methylase RsmC
LRRGVFRADRFSPSCAAGLPSFESAHYHDRVIDLHELVNKTVPLKWNGAELKLDLSHALFSSFDIDVGTRLLLKTVARDPVLAAARRVLDAGCGVGVIGLAVAKAFPGAEVVLRDRDSLAVAFTERNRRSNKLRDTMAWVDPATGESRDARLFPRVGVGLLADGREGGPFDYVLSNLPAKAGAPVLEAFFARAGAPDLSRSFLAPGGRLAVVIVHTLADVAAQWIERSGLAIVDTARGSMHRVFVVERASSGAEVEGRATQDAPWPLAEESGPYFDIGGLDLSVYVRREGRFKLGLAAYPARGFWGLPEFDTPSFGSSAAADLGERALAGSLVREALFINPGVGHLALWAAKRLGARAITGASRDLLSLAATGANLAAGAGFSGFAPGAVSDGPVYRAADSLRLEELPEASQDLILETPDIVPAFDWAAQSWARAQRLVKAGGIYMAVCPPTEIARLEKRRVSGWRLLGERRKRGSIAMAWQRI